MEEFEINDGILEKYHGAGGDVVIPAGVREISYSAFYDCTELTSVVVPEGVTEIGKDAFRYCERLTSVTLPHSIELIAYQAFRGCDSITSITVRDIHFDRELIRDLAETWKIEPWKIFNVLCNTTSPLVSLSMYKYPIIWAAFRLCPSDEKTTFYIQSHVTQFLSFSAKTGDSQMFWDIMKNDLFQDGIMDSFKWVPEALIEYERPVLLRAFLYSGRYDDALRACIDDLIEYAIREKKLEYQLLLTNYKREKLGYTDVSERFEL
ncbi:MAG: leucine-rich repeat domain-containing protein [Oscillospiraceae bacterium]|nr:leucine-rich repeat domain-containing protein [Oscillospiraceae bacterium]